jgi:Fur family peroxide stress response transcriptional regulator
MINTSTKKEPIGKTKRFTKQRQAILETLKTTYTHPDANWIYKKVSKKVPNISLGTVYRNLNILTEENIIRELSLQPNVTRYDANTHQHHHIMCYNCHKIEDVVASTECEVQEKLKNNVEKEYNYTNISCEIVFTGLCSDCQNAKN